MQPKRTYNLRFLAAQPSLAAERQQRIPTNRSPIQLGVFVALALNAGQPTSRALIARIAYGQDYTSGAYDASIETAVSRLRRECGLRISEGDYVLDMDPGEIDLLDFQARAAVLIDASTGARRSASSATDLDALVSEGLDLQSVWEYDPRSYFAKRPSIAAVFDPHIKRHVRFGRTAHRAAARSRRDRHRRGCPCLLRVPVPRRGVGSARGSGRNHSADQAKRRSQDRSHVPQAAPRAPCGSAYPRPDVRQ